ncbi:plant-type putative serine-threonine protein kinase [Phyllosticta capitalensis]
MGFLSLLSSTLFLSLALGAPQAQTDSTKKDPPPNTGTGGEVKLAANLERDKQTIQEFGKKVTEDPKGIVKSWSGPDPCKYVGFKCDKTPKGYNAIAALDFNGYQLGGPDLEITGLLDKLVDLAIFHANSNKFVKSIPEQLGQIPYLYELDVSNNQLSGPFPKGVLTATKLTFLDLRFNQFEGSVPSDVFHMDLDVLFLNNNKFTGSIPSDLGASPALYITLANNQFDGSLPSELNNMKKLKEILFLGNKFSGSLPTELGGMVETTVFDVSANQLSGSVPESLCNLPKMELLTLAKNQFSDSLPTNMGGMKALDTFDASDNKLSGTVPESLCSLPKVKHIKLMNNDFHEDLGPACLEALKKKVLDVSGNCIKNAPNQKPGCSGGDQNTDRTRLSQPNGQGTQGTNPST